MSETSSPEVRPKGTHGRSRLTNGTALLPGVDGRSTWARRLRDVMETLTADLGGEETLSEAHRSIIRRASCLTVELERLEAKFAKAGEADADDIDLYGRTAGNLRRLLECVGLTKPVRDTPRFTNDIDTVNEFDLARRVAFAMAMAGKAPQIIDIEVSSADD